MKVDLQTKIQSDLNRVKKRLDAAIETLESMTARVEALTRQRNALQSAIDIMDGKPQVKFPELMAPSIFAAPSPVAMPSSLAAQPPVSFIYESRPEMVTVNGEPVILEPGYEVRKNGRGEESIVPIGMPTDEIPEPIKPAPTASILPPISMEDSFVSDTPF